MLVPLSFRLAEHTRVSEQLSVPGELASMQVTSQRIKFDLISTLLIWVRSCHLHKNGEKRS